MSNNSLDTIESATAPENEQLRTENKRLETETANLRKELARLRGTNLKKRHSLKPWSQGMEWKRRLLKDILGALQNVAVHYETSVSLQISCTEVHVL